MNISKVFKDFPDEATLIARLIAGYTDLEIDLMNCIKELHQNFDMVFKAIYIIRGASKRIELAEIMGKLDFTNLDLGDDFQLAINGLKHCVKIRNQYAHSTFWNDYSGKVAFSNIEALAKSREVIADLRGINIKHLDISILRQQIQYYDFVSDLLVWILNEANSKRGLPHHPGVLKPSFVVEPALY